MFVRSSWMLALFLASCSSPDRKAAPVEPECGVGEVVLRAGPFDPGQSERFATIGDTLLMTASGHEELTLSKCIDIDGTILLPELGAVAVAGYSSAELEQLLAEKWSPCFPKLDLHVRIENTGRRALYFIYGEVGAPGEKRLLADTTIFEAVMAASPREARADLEHVRVFQGESPGGQEVDLALMQRSGDSSHNLLLQECDVIFVPPTLTARVACLLDFVREWLHDWILHPPILIAGSPSR